MMVMIPKCPHCQADLPGFTAPPQQFYGTWEGVKQWQVCPVCNGRGIDPFVTASSTIPTRMSHPCHSCMGSGKVVTP